MLGWLPVNGANNYRVQISTKRDFTAIVDEAQPQFMNYVPWQGRHAAMPFGTVLVARNVLKITKVQLGDRQ